MKILFIGYYELKEHLKHIKDVLEEYNYQVLNYPLFQYAYDSNDKLENYEEHLIEYINNNNIDVILWWFLDVPNKVFKTIKNEYPDIYYIMFNSDDPNNINLVSRCEIFDVIMTPCMGFIEEYTKFNNKAKIIWNPSGFDPTFFFPLDDNNYDCDISILCYDLLLDPYFNKQTVPRKVLIDNVLEYCKNNNKRFNIYGSFALKEIYPDNYVGDISYLEHNNIINKSRINICTHAFNNYELGVTDMEFKILGARGLLFMDATEKIQDIFINNVNCMLYSQNDYISKINKILNNYDNYDSIKNNGYLLSKNYSWKKFIERMHIDISKKFFNNEYYRKVYDVKEDKLDLWNYWLDIGLKNNHICYKLDIPSSFDYDKYKNDTKIDQDIEYLYHNWFISGKNKKYIKKIINTNSNNNIGVDFPCFDTTREQIFKLYSAFNDVYDGKIDKGLKRIAKISKYNPNIKINDALKKYIELTF